MFPIYGFSSRYFIEQCCWYNVKITSNNMASQIIYEWRTLTSTTIPHSKLKDKLRELVQLCFIKKNGQRGYKYLVLWRDRSCFVKKKTDSPKRFSETDIINMLEFHNIFVIFGGRVFNRQSEADFKLELLKKNEKKLARSFNFTFRYIDDVLSLDNSRFGYFVDRIYPIELDIKDTTDKDRSAAYLDLHLEIDSEGRIRTKLRQQILFQFYHCELSIYM